MNYNVWNKKEEDLLKSLMDKMSFIDMNKYFNNRTSRSLKAKAKRMDIVNNYQYHKYEVNKQYWKELNLYNCYYAGYIASDGNLKKDEPTVSFHIHIKDKDILKKFSDDCGFTGKINEHRNKKTEQITCSLRIHGVNEWHRDLLNNFNITPQKTFTLKKPNLNNRYLEYSYLIGLLDGDGHICNKKDGRIAIGFVGASLELIEWVRDKFKEICGKSYKITQVKNKNYYLFSISGINGSIIIDYLRQFPVPKLDRKWNNPEVLRYIQEQKQKFPHLFLTLDKSEISKYLPK